MKFENKEYPKVRVTKQAHAHLAKLIPAIREARGLNVSMTDFVSELILNTKLPEPAKAAGVPSEKKRKAQPSTAAVPAL